MEFIKANLFKTIMENSSYKENEETFNDLFIPEMDKFLTGGEKIEVKEEEFEDIMEYNYWLFYATL